MGLVGASRSIWQRFAYFAIGVLIVVAFLIGDVPWALVMIFVAEVLLFFWRPTPALGPASYTAPTPASWQAPIRVLRWSALISTWWAVVWGSALFGVILGIVIVVLRLRGLGPGNFVVAGLVAVWLLTRPLWAPLLKKSVAQEARKNLSKSSPWITAGPDGIYFELRVTQVSNMLGAVFAPSIMIGRSPSPKRRWIFNVTFAEIEEARTLGPLEAQAYWESLMQYDLTLVVRAVAELNSYYNGKIARPSILGYLTVDTHILVRSPSVLYVIGGANERAAPAVAAWQAWRATHEAPKSPSAETAV